MGTARALLAGAIALIAVLLVGTGLVRTWTGAFAAEEREGERARDEGGLVVRPGEEENIIVPGASEGQRTALDIVPRGAVQGTLTDAHGEPLPLDSARLCAIGPSGESVLARAGRDGWFSVQGLAWGRWRIECAGADTLGNAQSFELSAERPIAEVDLVVERLRSVEVEIVLDGAPDEIDAGLESCSGALRAVWIEPAGASPAPSGPRATRWTPLGLDGRGRLHVPQRASVEIGAALGELVLQRLTFGTADESVELHVPAAAVRAALASLSFRVVDETGASVAGARATVRTEDGARCELSLADGFVSGRCPPGALLLAVHAPGRARSETRLHAAPAESVELGAIVLERARSARGRVVDRSGRPCSVPLVCERRDAAGDWVAVDSEGMLHSSVEGLFRLEALGPGEHRVTAAIEGSAPTRFTVEADPVEGLEVVAGAP